MKQPMPALLEAAMRHRTLEEVLRWCARLEPPATIVDVIGQDEFSHDVLVGLPDGVWLVYDTS